MKTEKLKFISDGFVSGRVEFEKGKIYDIPVETGSVARWLKRGVAVVVESLQQESVVSEKTEPDSETTTEVGIDPLSCEILETTEELVGEIVEETVEPEQDVQEEEQIAKKQPKNQNKKKENLGKGL
jgi:hypothetical protein